MRSRPIFGSSQPQQVSCATQLVQPTYRGTYLGYLSSRTRLPGGQENKSRSAAGLLKSNRLQPSPSCLGPRREGRVWRRDRGISGTVVYAVRRRVRQQEDPFPPCSGGRCACNLTTVLAHPAALTVLGGASLVTERLLWLPARMIFDELWTGGSYASARKGPKPERVALNRRQAQSHASLQIAPLSSRCTTVHRIQNVAQSAEKTPATAGGRPVADPVGVGSTIQGEAAAQNQTNPFCSCGSLIHARASSLIATRPWAVRWIQPNALAVAGHVPKLVNTGRVEPHVT